MGPLKTLLGLCLVVVVMSGSGTVEAAKFSLEELMLLTDAAEKAQKKGSEDYDPSKVSNFQHRLNQLIQTARVAAGSGQSTGSDVLDQTIRQVRARVNANAGGGGPSISDSAIFDAAVRSLAGKGGAAEAGSGSSGVSPQIVDTIVQQLSPGASTTPSPADDSFLGGVLRQLANNQNSEGGKSRTILDAVVNQLVSTTTTTTTTTTPKPQVLQILDGLVKAYQGRNAPQPDAGSPPASPQSGTPNPGQLLEGFQNILKQIQSKQNSSPAAAGEASGDSQPGPAAPPTNGPSGTQILEGFINQLKNLQNKNDAPGSDSTGSAQGGPNLAFLGGILQQFQARLNPTPGTASSDGPSGPSGSGAGPSLEGFDGLIPEGGAAGQATPTTPPSTPQQTPTQTPAPATPTAATNKNNEALKFIGGFVRQLSDSSQQSNGGQGAQNFLAGLGKLFANRS